ncbi:hypothetical protein [Dictyobacter arantiisoli]|uniref:DUF4351 domain-containing protein n=1 Tax=Dictyobacter arantiisoli TaxID=2014874 RepID=A0A5A5T8Q7_9CHLR|nr:hypothetical protein [Dictyobacter arantiisoli]GCF07737.1 hypothetical protein KDI_13010 [Dictyobacter arantiisoli]
MRFHFDIIKLWELPTAVLFQKHLKGILPLAPITQEGARREVVDEAIKALLKDDPENQNKDLLSLLYGISSLVFDDQADKQWLDWRFRMLEDLLNDSWAFRELRQRGEEIGLAKGREEGRIEGILESLRLLVQRLFPSLLALLEDFPQKSFTAKELNAILLQVVAAQTEEEARQYLLTALQQHL